MNESGDEPDQGRHFLRQNAGLKWKICKGGRIIDALERCSVITGNSLSTIHYFYMDRIILDHWTASEGQSFLIGVPFQAFTVMRLKGISI